ncbi:hypothetical protein Taro_043188 [Colocasia esculenta]|uniref:Uncharacterized protein n=1 Tax=Colocasia esculenta TaxID=4460 RepID=A0A843WRG0_COLES|nr:hypothetical protein [Colocasia esculenta]
MRRASWGGGVLRHAEGTGISRGEEDLGKGLMAVAAAAKKGSCMEIKRRGCAPAAPLPRPASAATPARPRVAVVRSVTRDEIDRFWRRKRMEEEDHLLAALKAAARIRARNLKARILLALSLSPSL